MLQLSNKRVILFIIVVSQFLCTSLWFASNGIMGDLIADFQLSETALGYLTSAVQLGFIVGTLLFALSSMVDRYAPSRIFFICALLGALFNIGIILPSNTLFSLVTLRFFTGFCLAGIYPVGMKIAADYFEKGLGKSLGFLVGALVLGTALPHILKDTFSTYPWQYPIKTTSLLAGLGGFFILLFIGDGPYRTKGASFKMTNLCMSFKNSDFRKAAWGYFGHMWELYAFWAFVPFMLAKHNELFPDSTIGVPFWSFIIIGVGSLGCIVAGQLTSYFKTKNTGLVCLIVSGICCLLFPWLLLQGNSTLLLGFMIVWGVFVIADSPLFSTLVALHAIPTNKGTAITIVTCIGFSISIISIQGLTFLTKNSHTPYVFMLLVVGPVIGSIALLKKEFYIKKKHTR